jgi:predicted nucleic acid-binding protein
VLVGVLRGHEATIEMLVNLRRRLSLATSTVTAFELLRGQMTPRRTRDVTLLLGEFEILPLDLAAASEAAAIDRKLRAAGQGLPPGDTLIAGTALANGLPVLTHNVRHFGRIEGLILLDPA